MGLGHASLDSEGMEEDGDRLRSISAILRLDRTASFDVFKMGTGEEVGIILEELVVDEGTVAVLRGAVAKETISNHTF